MFALERRAGERFVLGGHVLVHVASWDWLLPLVALRKRYWIGPLWNPQNELLATWLVGAIEEPLGCS